METEKLRVLLTALDCGSLSAAAEKLGYTPSGVSRAVQALEEELGLELLRRTRWGVEATESCAQLLPRLRELVNAAEGLEQEARALKGLETGRLRIGSSYGSYSRALAALLTAYCRQHPGIRVETREGSSSALCQAMTEGQLDLCLISRREGDFDWLPLQTDPLLAVLPEDHPLAEAAGYPTERFREDPFIEILPGAETDNSRLFARLGIRPNVRYSSADDRTAMSLVEAGLGVTLVNRLLLQDWQGRVKGVPLSPPQQVEIGFAVPSLRHSSPAARGFLTFVRAELERTTNG